MRAPQTLLLLATATLLVAGCNKSPSTSSSARDAAPSTASTTAAPATPPPPSPGLDQSDRDFVTKAAQGGLLEVQAGQLASTQGSSPKIKQFGSMMVKDHTAANNDLQAMARNKQVDLPSDLDAEHQAKIDELKALKGKAFDRAYAKMMVADHKEDVQDFSNAVEALQDTDVRTFAEKTLPTLKEHLAKAEGLPGQRSGKTQARSR